MNLDNVYLNKKEFKTKDDCGFTIVAYYGSDWDRQNFKIEIISTKALIKQRLNDYMQAYIYLISNKFIHDIDVFISNNGDVCEISFNIF